MSGFAFNFCSSDSFCCCVHVGLPVCRFNMANVYIALTKFVLTIKRCSHSKHLNKPIKKHVRNLTKIIVNGLKTVTKYRLESRKISLKANQEMAAFSSGMSKVSFSAKVKIILKIRYF